MNGPSGTDLLALRLAAAQRDNERLRTFVPALQSLADSIYVELVNNGWDATEALAVVMQELNRAQQRLTRICFP